MVEWWSMHASAASSSAHSPFCFLQISIASMDETWHTNSGNTVRAFRQVTEKREERARVLDRGHGADHSTDIEALQRSSVFAPEHTSAAGFGWLSESQVSMIFMLNWQPFRPTYSHRFWISSPDISRLIESEKGKFSASSKSKLGI